MSLNVDVHEFFGTDWLDRGGLRVNFIASTDGAIAVAGLSKGLQTPGDNRIFAALRDLADVVLVGAGTAAAENYRPARPGGERRARRQAAGLAGDLPIAVVSRTLRLDPASELFTAATSIARTLVLTCAAADPEQRRALAEHAEVIDCGDTDVDALLVRAALHERGFTRILCEGGPTLFGQLAAAGTVDELCLSVSPLLAGPGSGRITAGGGWAHGPLGLDLIGLLEEDGALFSRYRVRRAPVS